jgi:hypothetical protein
VYVSGCFSSASEDMLPILCSAHLCSQTDLCFHSHRRSCSSPGYSPAPSERRFPRYPEDRPAPARWHLPERDPRKTSSTGVMQARPSSSLPPGREPTLGQLDGEVEAPREPPARVCTQRNLERLLGPGIGIDERVSAEVELGVEQLSSVYPDLDVECVSFRFCWAQKHGLFDRGSSSLDLRKQDLTGHIEG